MEKFLELIIVNLSTIISILYFVFLVFIIFKYKLSKYQVALFFYTMLFWSGLKVIRPFFGVYAKELDIVQVTAIIGAYGLISIFVRYPLGLISDKIKNKLTIMNISMVLLLISSVLVYFNPNLYTLYISNLVVGIGASVWGIINVAFAQSFENKKVFASIAILSMAPLFADVYTAPIQAFARENAQTNLMWLVAAFFAVITILFSFITKLNQEARIEQYRGKFTMKLFNKEFIAYCVIGILVIFVKFASADNNAQTFAVELNMGPVQEGYLSFIFTQAQLLAGVISGIVLAPKIGKKYTLLLGIVSMLIYTFAMYFVTSPNLMFWLFAFNGFGYGLTYTLLIALVLNIFEKNIQGQAMGIYQTVLAIGIYFGASVSSELNIRLGSYQYVMLGLSAVLIILFIYTLGVVKNDRVRRTS